MKKRTGTKQRKRKIQAGHLQKGIAAWMIGTGLVVGFCDGLNISYTMVLCVLFAGIGVLWSMGTGSRKYGTAVGIGGLLALVVLLIVGGDKFLNGIFYLYQEAIETLGRSGTCFLTAYQLLVEETAMRDAQLCLAVLSMTAGWCCYMLISSSGKIMAAVCLVLAAAFLCIHTEESSGWVLLGLGSVFLIIDNSYAERSKAAFFSCAAVSLCFMAAVYAGSWLLPKQSYEEPRLVKQIRTEVLQKVDQLRYQKAKLNTLPKGKLAEAENWETTEETALRVKMSEQTSLYLRGFVGSVYDTDHWETLLPETYYDNQALFYWLKQWGFSGNAQLSALRECLEDESLAAETITIEIENVNADSEYVYLPYEFVSFETDSLGLEDEFMEQAVAAGGLFGKRSYSYCAYQNLVKDFPQLAAQAYLYNKEHSQDHYTEAESYYNVFVYENFTQLPERVRTLLKKELGYAGETMDAHADYRSVITKIRTYLEKHITYGNYAEKLPEDEDFLSFFLTESKIGSSVHYATAAALMFRYYGIPARYAEGYLITPQDTKLQGEVIELTGSSGHAWTEIYVDGLGWVPIEMTPEYYGVMEEPDLSIGLQTDASRVITPPQTQMQEPEKNTSEQLKEHLTQIFLNLGKWILLLLILFDLGCLLLFLYLQIRRTAANLKRYRQFRQKDSRRAICSMIGYMRQLNQEAEQALQNERKNRYAQAYQIGQKAAFSLHSLSEEERNIVNESRKSLLKAVKKEKGWYDRWILKYIKRLY